MSRLVFVALIAIYHIQALNALNQDFCSGRPVNNNYLCFDALGHATVCACKGRRMCPLGNWYDPIDKECTWSRGFLFRLIECMQGFEPSDEEYTGTPANFCRDKEDGNYACDSTEDSDVCACFYGKACKDGQWYDPESQGCTYMTNVLLPKMNTCLKTGPAPTPAPTTTSTAAPTLAPKVCPAGWLTVGTYCYKAILEGMTYDKGLERCQQEDPEAHLAYVPNAQQNNAIVKYLQQFKGKANQCRIHQAYDYIYLTCGQRADPNSCTSNMFEWQVDSTETMPVTKYYNWASGEPNCYQGRQENCLVYRCLNDGNTCYWNDYLCTFTGCLLCQIDLLDSDS